jgi:membrane-bound inhibitor of C-type lysozyme
VSAVCPLHHAALVASLLAVGLVACSKKEESTTSTDSAATSTPAPASSAPAAPAGSPEGQANTKYLCSSNIVLAVSYEPGVAKFTYKDKPLEFKAEAAEPTRYITAGYEWWVNGRGQGANGNLYTQAADGTTGEFIEGCIENPNK